MCTGTGIFRGSSGGVLALEYSGAVLEVYWHWNIQGQFWRCIGTGIFRGSSGGVLALEYSGAVVDVH